MIVITLANDWFIQSFHSFGQFQSSILYSELLTPDFLLGDGDCAHQGLGRVDVGGGVLLYEALTGGLARGGVLGDVEVGGDAGQHHVVRDTRPGRPERKQGESQSGLAWSYFTELGSEIRLFLKSPSVTLTVLREDRRLVQNNCRGFSRATCFSSGFTCR